MLLLLHDADALFENVSATYRIWRHDQRASAAFQAETTELRRRGVSIGSIRLRRDGSELGEVEELVRLWRSGDHVREEREGGPRDGSFAVRIANLWWSWDDRTGVCGNDGDSSGIAELAITLEPARLLGLLRLEAVGRSAVAGRETITAGGAPRLSGHAAPSVELHQLGRGADRYDLQVDAQTGVLLEVIALRDGEPFHKITAEKIAFNEPIPDERFSFDPPGGEDRRRVRGQPRPQPVSVREAQKLAPFVVFVPARIPPDWRVTSVFVESCQHPRWPAQVSLHYSADDGHTRVSLLQSSVTSLPTGWLEQLTSGAKWEEIIHNGTVIWVAKADARRPQAQAHLECDGTFVFLTSETLDTVQLAALASRLKPTASIGSI